jgi:hypothetical protein
MPVLELVFYTSSSGDQWLLNNQDDVLSVRHQPNQASGGRGQLYELGAFLMLEQHSAQNQALRSLIATLVTTAPMSIEEQAVTVYDQQAARDGLVEVSSKD